MYVIVFQLVICMIIYTASELLLLTSIVQAPLPQDIPTPVVDLLAENPEEQVTQIPLPTGYFVRLVTIIAQGSLTSLSDFLTRILQSELETIPRGVVSSAQQQSQNYSSLEKAVRGVENMLQGMCLANCDKDSTYGLVSGNATCNLCCFVALLFTIYIYSLCTWMDLPTSYSAVAWYIHACACTCRCKPDVALVLIQHFNAMWRAGQIVI